MRTAVFLVILITLHNFTCFFCLSFNACTNACKYHCKYSVFNNDRRRVKVFSISIFYRPSYLQICFCGSRIYNVHNQKSLEWMPLRTVSIKYGLWTVDCGLWTADCGLRTTDCRLGIKQGLIYFIFILFVTQ